MAEQLKAWIGYCRIGEERLSRVFLIAAKSERGALMRLRKVARVKGAVSDESVVPCTLFPLAEEIR